MDYTVREHTVRLQEKLQSLRDRLTKGSLTKAERACTQHEITIAELALGNFIEALELEQKIA